MRVFFLFLLLIQNIYSTQVILTQEEKDFIKNHPAITLAGGESFEPFLIKNSDESISGYDFGIVQLIKKRTGLNIEFELGNWAVVQEKAKKRLLDGLSSSSVNEERKKHYNSSLPYFKYSSLVIVRKGNPLKIHNKNDLKNKKIAVQKGNSFFTNLAKSLNGVEIVYYEKMHDLIRAVVSAEVDFTIIDETAFYIANEIGLKPFIEHSFVIGKPSDLVFSLRNDWPELTTIVNKGLRSIKKQELIELKERWIGINLDIKSDIKFTQKEKNYLSKKKQIKLCVDPNWMPYSKIENGIHKGMGADIVNLLQEKLPIPIELVNTTSWTETLEYVEQKKCDILDFVVKTKERSRYINFSPLYVEIPLVVATRLDTPFFLNLRDLSYKKLGVVKSYAFKDMLKQRYPDIEIVFVSSIKDGLEKVKKGEIYGYVGALASVAYEFKENFTGELKISGRFDESMSMGSGVRKDDKTLFAIINKIVDNIDKNRLNVIINNWITIKYEKEIDHTLVWQILGVVFMLFLLGFYRQFILKKANNTLNEKIQKELALSRKKDNLIFQKNKMASLGEIVGSISHQWRQPLAELSMSQNILLKKIEEDELEKTFIKDELEDAQKIVKFMANTIGVFENLYSTTNITKISTIKVFDLTKDIRYIIKEQIKLGSIEYIEEFDKALHVEIDKDFLVQILLILLQNSIYFLKEREIKKPHIKLTIKHSDHLHVSIEDNAGGIEKKILPHIFEYGFSSRKDENHSTGIGLYMAKLIVEERLKSTLHVESIKKGVRFSFALNYT